MQTAVCLGEDRAEELSVAVGERECGVHERQRGVYAERAGVQELPEVHDGEQYHVREVGGQLGTTSEWRRDAGIFGARKSNGPELGTRGLHSEGGGGRGLTARMLSVLDSE